MELISWYSANSRAAFISGQNHWAMMAAVQHDDCVYTKPEIERIAHLVFSYAQKKKKEINVGR